MINLIKSPTQRLGSTGIGRNYFPKFSQSHGPVYKPCHSSHEKLNHEICLTVPAPGRRLSV